MHTTTLYRLDLNTVLFRLFCVYAFLLPFELVLEIELDIDTIFKPFRVVSLLIIGTYGIQIIRNGLQFKQKDGYDIWLYGVFAYGILISFYRIVTEIFNIRLFRSDLFQAGLYLLTFFIFKNLSLSRKRYYTLFRYFIAGFLINAIFVFNSFYFLGHHGRQSGYMDNPNYLALGTLAIIIFLVINPSKIKFRSIIGRILLLSLFIYVFIIAGSRTGFVMLLVSIFLLFLFVSLKKKLGLIFIGTIIVLFLLPQQLDRAKLGGPLILINRLTTDLDDGEGDVRFAVWRGVFRALEDQGYWGMGIGQFKAQFPKYFYDEPRKLILEIVNRGYFLSTHNDYLAILTDYGLPALILYLLFLFFTGQNLLSKVLTRWEDDSQRRLHQFKFVLFVCLIIFGLGAENFAHQLFWFLLMYSTKMID